jgi:adenylosuccinate synthase
MKTIKVCTHYIYGGHRYVHGQVEYKKGSAVMDPPMDAEFLSKCVPVYKEFPGWDEDISKIKNYDDLPYNLSFIIYFINSYLKRQLKPAIISVGPDREETIIV